MIIRVFDKDIQQDLGEWEDDWGVEQNCAGSDFQRQERYAELMQLQRNKVDELWKRLVEARLRAEVKNL